MRTRERERARMCRVDDSGMMEARDERCSDLIGDDDLRSDLTGDDDLRCF